MIHYDIDFNLSEKLEELKQWIRDYAKDCRIVVGISGGTDSTVVSKLLVEALGVDKVIGILMPNQFQRDIDIAENWCKTLGIEYHIIDIFNTYRNLTLTFYNVGSFSDKYPLTENYRINTPARIRMVVLYSIAAIVGNARVVNTCNLSEDWVGYSTKFGDSAGDFSPLAHFTKTEVRELGRLLGISEDLISKTPEDGLSGMSDEEKLGFTYETLDKYIRTGILGDYKLKEKIDKMHVQNLHKVQLMPSFLP